MARKHTKQSDISGATHNPMHFSRPPMDQINPDDPRLTRIYDQMAALEARYALNTTPQGQQVHQAGVHAQRRHDGSLMLGIDGFGCIPPDALRASGHKTPGQRKSYKTSFDQLEQGLQDTKVLDDGYSLSSLHEDGLPWPSNHAIKWHTGEQHIGEELEIFQSNRYTQQTYSWVNPPTNSVKVPEGVRKLSMQRVIEDCEREGTPVPEGDDLIRAAKKAYIKARFCAGQPIEPVLARENMEQAFHNFQVHVHYLFPIASERRWFIQWLAHEIVNPEVRAKVTPLHVSKPHGTGRGWLVEFLKALLIPGCCSETTIQDMVSGAFNYSWMYGKTMTFVHEVAAHDGKQFEISGPIRTLMTEAVQEVNQKYGDKGPMTIYNSFLWMSNHEDAINLTADDRRVQVLSGPAHKHKRGYYAKLWQWSECNWDTRASSPKDVPGHWGVHNAVRLWLKGIVITHMEDYNGQESVMTQGKQRMVYLAEPGIKRHIDGIMLVAKAPYLSSNDIIAAVREQAGTFNWSKSAEAEIDRMTPGQVAKVMRGYGAQDITNVSVRGVLCSVWRLPKAKQVADEYGDILCTPPVEQLSGPARRRHAAKEYSKFLKHHRSGHLVLSYGMSAEDLRRHEAELMPAHDDVAMQAAAATGFDDFDNPG